MLEVWKPVPDFPRYEASNLGRIRSFQGRHGPYKEPLVLRDAQSGRGYRAVVLWNEHGKKQMYVHQLVLSAFRGPAPSGHEGAHLDGVRSNNRLDNLAWTTRSENHGHKIIHGTTNRGERSGTSKLTTAEVRAMRSEYRFGEHGRGTHSLAEKYGVSQSEAYDIVNWRRWAHLDAPEVSSIAGLSARETLLLGAI